MRRVSLPLLLAAVIAVGTSVVLVLQITVLSPTPSVVFPIELPASSSATTITRSYTIAAGESVGYGTIAGMGNLRLTANTTGWRYAHLSYVGVAALAESGNATFTVDDLTIYIRGNGTHGVVGVASATDLYVTPARKVTFGGWTVYHPTYVDLTSDARMRQFVVDVINAAGKVQAKVLQARHDYLRVNSNGSMTVYYDTVTSTGSVSVYGFTAPYTGTELSAGTPVDVNGRTCPTSTTCFMGTVLAWYRGVPKSSVNSALTVTAR